MLGGGAGLLHYMEGFQAFFRAESFYGTIWPYINLQVVSYVCVHFLIVHALDKYIAVRHNV